MSKNLPKHIHLLLINFSLASISSHPVYAFSWHAEVMLTVQNIGIVCLDLSSSTWCDVVRDYADDMPVFTKKIVNRRRSCFKFCAILLCLVITMAVWVILKTNGLGHCCDLWKFCDVCDENLFTTSSKMTLQDITTTKTYPLFNRLHTLV